MTIKCDTRIAYFHTSNSMIDIKIQWRLQKKFIDFLLSQTQIHFTDVYSHNSIATKEKERKQIWDVLFEEERNQFIGNITFANANHL